MRRKQRKLWQPVAAGFGVLYLVTMGLSTLLVKDKYVEDYGRRLEEVASTILERASEKEFAMKEQGFSGKEKQIFYQGLANDFFWMTDGERIQISVACYDKEKSLLAQSRNEIGSQVREGSTSSEEYEAWDLGQLLTAKEIEELAAYLWENQKIKKSWGYALPEPYRFSIQAAPEEPSLWGIYVQKITWEESRKGEEKKPYTDPLTGCIYSMETGDVIDYETGEESGESRYYHETDSQVVWSWVNPDAGQEERQRGRIMNTSLFLPYIDSPSIQSWRRWNDSTYLHGFLSQGEFSREPGKEYSPLEIHRDGFSYQARYRLQVGMAGDPFSYLEIRMECRPWLDAMNYLKFLYLVGFCFTLECAGKLLSVFQKIYAKQAALEETRRDITNAMAHELKTPLSVIRNFAENLMEHNMEEKRDYYLTQIIGQTEEMDRLVTEMIQISRLDSQEGIRRKETIQLSGLLKEQLERFTPMIQEKRLQVQVQREEEFTVEGDREYLEKAVWNLLSNAVDYNIPGGSIQIRISRKSCTIENTGPLLDEDTLLHAFDLFYTGDKSRNKREGHMGLGLYLAKKILTLHGLGLTLENQKGEPGRIQVEINPLVSRNTSVFFLQNVVN